MNKITFKNSIQNTGKIVVGLGIVALSLKCMSENTYGRGTPKQDTITLQQAYAEGSVEISYTDKNGKKVNLEPRTQFGKYAKKCREYLEDGDVGSAFAMLNKAGKTIETYPQASEWYFLASKTYFQQKDYDNAIEYAKEALLNNKNNKEAKKVLADIQEIKQIQAKKEADEKTKVSNVVQGNAFENDRKFWDAIDCYKKAIDIDTKYAEAQQFLASAYAKLEKIDFGITEAEGAIEREKDSTRKGDRHLTLAMLYAASNDYDKAIEMCAKGLKMNPKNENMAAMKEKYEQDNTFGNKLERSVESSWEWVKKHVGGIITGAVVVFAIIGKRAYENSKGEEPDPHEEAMKGISTSKNNNARAPPTRRSTNIDDVLGKKEEEKEKGSEENKTDDDNENDN